jgi:hypothetical protein
MMTVALHVLVDPFQTLESFLFKIYADQSYFDLCRDEKRLPKDIRKPIAILLSAFDEYRDHL